LGLVPILLPFWRSPVLPHPLLLPFTHPVLPLKILSSTQSITGLIVVGELLPPIPSSHVDNTQLHSLRYLRASHSLLGGVWLGDNAVSIDGTPMAFDEEGTVLGDSIYTAFLLQEAIRLFNVRETSEGDIQTNALIMCDSIAFGYCAKLIPFPEVASVLEFLLQHLADTISLLLLSRLIQLYTMLHVATSECPTPDSTKFFWRMREGGLQIVPMEGSIKSHLTLSSMTAFLAEEFRHTFLQWSFGKI
jgi:hypothetical protein